MNTGDYSDTRMTNKTSKDAVTVGYSINITQEALRIGKLPTEKVARNLARGLYNKDGSLKNS